MKIRPKLFLTALLFLLICLNSCFFRPHSSEEKYMKQQKRLQDKEQKRAYKESRDKHFNMQSETMQAQMKLSKKRSKKFECIFAFILLF